MKIYATLVTIAFAIVFVANIISERANQRAVEIIANHENCVSWCAEQWNDYGC